MKEHYPVPEPAKNLIRNLKRRGGLLARISGAERQEPSEIPEIVIKDTLLKFLDRMYKGLSEESIKDINMRIFTLLNRAAAIAKNKQSTAPITSMYSFQRKGARTIEEGTYQEYKLQVKELIMLCQKYNVPLSSITSMQSGLGIPDIKDEKISQAILSAIRQTSFKNRS